MPRSKLCTQNCQGLLTWGFPGKPSHWPLPAALTQPRLSHSLSRSAPLLETAQGNPSALQLLPAAVTVEAGSKVTGNNERDIWVLNEHGGPVQRSRHRCGNFRRPSLCRISLQRTSKPVVTRTLRWGWARLISRVAVLCSHTYWICCKKCAWLIHEQNKQSAETVPKEA